MKQKSKKRPAQTEDSSNNKQNKSAVTVSQIYADVIFEV